MSIHRQFPISPTPHMRTQIHTATDLPPLLSIQKFKLAAYATRRYPDIHGTDLEAQKGAEAIDAAADAGKPFFLQVRAANFELILSSNLNANPAQSHQRHSTCAPLPALAKRPAALRRWRSSGVPSPFSRRLISSPSSRFFFPHRCRSTRRTPTLQPACRRRTRTTMAPASPAYRRSGTRSCTKTPRSAPLCYRYLCCRLCYRR